MEKFARRCDVTGEPMNEGWCWGEGMFYTATEESTITELRKEYPSKVHITDDELMQYAYDNEVLYWTEWYSDEIEEQGFYFTKDGEEVAI